MLAPKKARCGSVSSPNYITTTQQTCCQFVRTSCGLVSDILSCQDSLPYRLVCNKLATSLLCCCNGILETRMLRGNVSNEFWEFDSTKSYGSLDKNGKVGISQCNLAHNMHG